MNEAEVIQVFKDSGAILEGHFILSSGLRSPLFIQKARVFMYPDRTERLCRALAEKVRAANLGPIDLVVSPANAEAAALIDRWPDWPATVVVLAGPPGAGKTHLATIWREMADAALLVPGTIAVGPARNRLSVAASQVSPLDSSALV